MMDADLSHQPLYLADLLLALSSADIVIGSRYVPGGGVENWPLFRRLASRIASRTARLVVGLKARDVTSGFAAFRRETAEPLLPSLNPRGFKLVVEILARAGKARVAEVPIEFVDRQRGRSKFTAGEAFAFLRLCWDLRRERGRLRPGKVHS
jgi:dolichol-phosphate mannosyltransferase